MIQFLPDNHRHADDTIGLQPMEFQFQPNNHRQSAMIPSGFSRWSFNFSLTITGKRHDTIGLQPMGFQFQPNIVPRVLDTIP
jgi:hypothetical protein